MGAVLSIWYCAEIEEGKSLQIRKDLFAAGFPVLRPTCLERRFAARFRRHKTVERSLFPGYMFVKHEIPEQPYQEIFKVRGVLGLLRKAGTDGPAQLDAEVMSVMEQRVKAGPARDDSWKKAFLKDAVVKATEGVWEGWTGVVQDSGEKRCWVLMTLFGRATRVEFDAGQLALAG